MSMTLLQPLQMALCFARSHSVHSQIVFHSEWAATL